MCADELWIERGGARLFATASGRGRALVLLHGGLATHAACRRFAEPLASRRRLVTPDLRASGRSVWGGELTWGALADDVAAWLDTIKEQRAIVGGISFGAGVALRVALQHPERVAAVVLLTPAFAGAELGLTPAQRAAMDAMAAAGARCVVDGMSALYPLLDALPEPMRARARAMVDAFDPASVASLTRFMASGAQPFARLSELAAVTAPVLIVPGADPTHPRAHAHALAAALPRATVVDVDAVAPDYAAVIEQFLTQADPP